MMSLNPTPRCINKVRFACGAIAFYESKSGYEARFQKDADGVLLDTRQFTEVCPPERTKTFVSEGYEYLTVSTYSLEVAQ